MLIAAAHPGNMSPCSFAFTLPSFTRTGLWQGGLVGQAEQFTVQVAPVAVAIALRAQLPASDASSMLLSGQQRVQRRLCPASSTLHLHPAALQCGGTAVRLRTSAWSGDGLCLSPKRLEHGAAASCLKMIRCCPSRRRCAGAPVGAAARDAAGLVRLPERDAARRLSPRAGMQRLPPMCA